MSRKHDDLVISTARNGYVITPGPAIQNVSMPKPYVFETFDSMVGWLRSNFIEGEQPNDD